MPVINQQSAPGQAASVLSSPVVVSTEQEAILTALKTALEIIDDWDETDRSKINPIVGQAGIAAGTGVDGVTVPRVSLATNVPLPTGSNAIGKLAANSGVDIGDVDILTMPSVAQATHDSLNANTNIQVGNTDVSQANPVPVALNDKSSQAVGSQQTNVDNVSNTYLTEIDLQDASWHDITLEVKIIQAAGDESANDFTLFWGFCSTSLTTNAPTQLATSEFSLPCDLTTGSTTRYYMTPIIQPKARYLSVWYDCNNLTVPLTSVDVSVNKLT